MQIGTRYFVGTTHSEYPLSEADAHLIAAAPELLAALKDLMWRFNDAEPPCNDADVMQARAAIAKAEGR